jgi:hypothetical protein
MELDPKAALAEVERQKLAMAARIRLPWWFLALFALTWAALVAGPILTREHAVVGLPSFPYNFAAVPVMLLLLIGFRRLSGLHLTVRSRAYPSLKRGRIPAVAILLGGAAPVWAIYLSGAPRVALAAAVLAGCLATAHMWTVNAGIRRDVLEGG